METIIHFNNEDGKVDRCAQSVYDDFIDYAFSESDFFMLVYVNYYGKGYTKVMKAFRDALCPFKVKNRTDPNWPGTLGQYCPNTTYKVVFYRNDVKAKEVLKRVDRLSAWSCPSYPQDLAFFKGNVCWAYSVGHEKIAAIINPTENDICFLEEHGLASRADIVKSKENYYEAYNENLIS